ncbi:hypothetical protein [Sphingorhabdus sp. Alg239-R122]|uniref:hypothetical protein n=1 Tax=Sphingorhabdus sp. Alg239-R122 TaxID=2305989 RepID=UPI0013DBE7E8|nr:hypothetical protein [Sphingorhabdus sp. Alg239-R122]
MKSPLIAVFAAALICAPASAGENKAESTENKAAVATEAKANAKDKPADSKIKCRKLEVTGSLVKRRKICRTIAEWREISRAGNRAARTMVDHANQGTTNGR